MPRIFPRNRSGGGRFGVDDLPMTDTTEHPVAHHPPRTAFADDDPAPSSAGRRPRRRGDRRRARPTELDAPTPCADYDVRELLDHLVMVLRRVAVGRPGRAADDLAHRRRPTSPTGGWPRPGGPAAHQVQAAWTDDALLERPTDAVPWGTFTGAEALGVYTNEVTVHTWDLAHATGQSPGLGPVGAGRRRRRDPGRSSPPPTAPRCGRPWPRLPPGVEWEPPFGDAVEVPADAPPSTGWWPGTAGVPDRPGGGAGLPGARPPGPRAAGIAGSRREGAR